MINLVVTGKPADGLFLYSYEYCDLLNAAGTLCNVVVVPHRLHTPQDYIDVIKSKYIHCENIVFNDNYQDFPVTMIMGRSMMTLAHLNFRDYSPEQQDTLKNLFSRRLISVYSENHVKEYPLAVEYFNPQEIQDLCDYDVYPNGVGEHFEKHINFDIYKPFKNNPEFEYLFLGTTKRYYDTVKKELPKFHDHGIITYNNVGWINPVLNNLYAPVEDLLGKFETYVYTKDHFDPAPRIIQECKKFGKHIIYQRSEDIVDGGSVYYKRDITKPNIEPIQKAFKNLMKIIPRCLSFLFTDRNDQGERSKGAAYTSDGYMLPCCWLDDPPVYRYVKACGLKDEELALANNDKLEDIFTSDQWESFFRTLLWDPDNAPYMCKKKCGVNIDKEKLREEERREVEYAHHAASK
jgi:hypothetical protein